MKGSIDLSICIGVSHVKKLDLAMFKIKAWGKIVNTINFDPQASEHAEPQPMVYTR